MLKELKAGKIKIHELEKYIDHHSAAEVRASFVEAETKLKLQQVAKHSLKPVDLYQKNIENLIGSVEIPLGVAGPLQVGGEYANDCYYIPLATTEGALVASTSRGCKAINLAGGAIVSLEYKGITRAPVFKTSGVKQGKQIQAWILDNKAKLNNLVKQANSYTSLLDVESYILGKNIWLRMFFDTSDAMGMNMATNAAQIVAERVLAEFPNVELIALSGNVCVDKKANSLNIISGRGRQVHAEVNIPNKIIKKVFKTTPQEIFEVYLRKDLLGGVVSGSLTVNAHAGNIIAAIFAATGQDLAHVIDSSACNLTMEVTKIGLYASVYLPSLIVGTVGGGTGIGKQAECLKIITTGINKQNKKNKTHLFAEVIAATVLAGELSLHAALATNTLHSAHQKLGQKKHAHKS